MVCSYEEIIGPDCLSDQGQSIYRPEGIYKTSGDSLFCMLQQLKPKKIIEIGSGFSSALMLDWRVRESQTTDMVFIDPFPQRLLSLIKPKDEVQIIASCVQDVDLELFKSLGENDILFIDSSHVSKTGSDVNFIYHEILPSLKTGVFIHVHDVCWNFEYPSDWISQGYQWNEQYLLRAFLTFNRDFEIAFFSDWLTREYEREMKTAMPNLFTKDGSGGQIWLKRT